MCAVRCGTVCAATFCNPIGYTFVIGARHQTMAFRINPLVAALPVLVLGQGACSAVATSGRFGDRNVLEG